MAWTKKDLCFLATVLFCDAVQILSSEGVKALLLLRFCQVMLILRLEY